MWRLWIGLVLVLAVSCGGDSGSEGDPPDAGKADSGTGAGLEFQRCCGKPSDCASTFCSSVQNGPFYCTQACQTFPDDCPVGFYCDEYITRCLPASTNSYTCNP